MLGGEIDVVLHGGGVHSRLKVDVPGEIA